MTCFISVTKRCLESKRLNFTVHIHVFGGLSVHILSTPHALSFIIIMLIRSYEIKRAFSAKIQQQKISVTEVFSQVIYVSYNVAGAHHWYPVLLDATPRLKIRSTGNQLANDHDWQIFFPSRRIDCGDKLLRSITFCPSPRNALIWFDSMLLILRVSVVVMATMSSGLC